MVLIKVNSNNTNIFNSLKNLKKWLIENNVNSFKLYKKEFNEYYRLPNLEQRILK